MIIAADRDQDQNQGLDQVLMSEIGAEDVEAKHQAIKSEEAEIKKIKIVNTLKIRKRRSIKNIDIDLLPILIRDRFMFNRINKYFINITQNFIIFWIGFFLNRLWKLKIFYLLTYFLVFFIQSNYKFDPLRILLLKFDYGLNLVIYLI
jgi:hypothetical protein